ncbi:MAG: DUF2452 domain-containing protein [Sphingobacteriales bacterium]|jgi:hypothetical protein|nr:DUF2452 domain-containing protein [Sphingobacteriales bacterium]
MIEENNFVNEDGSYIGPANLSPIPLSVGSPIIKAEDKGKLRANAVEAMHHYANQEMALLKKQADLIMEQVREIENRLKVSENIYTSDMRFQPVIGQVYHLYEKDDHFKLSIIGPTEWGRSRTVGNYVASVKLLGDHSWDIINKA